MQKAALLQATQINIARFCILTRLFCYAFWNFSIAQPKKSLQKSPSGTISILVTPPVRLMVRMRMRKMRFNRNAMSIFLAISFFVFSRAQCHTRGDKSGKLSDNDSCPTFCGCVYDVKSTNRNLYHSSFLRIIFSSVRYSSTNPCFRKSVIAGLSIAISS